MQVFAASACPGDMGATWIYPNDIFIDKKIAFCASGSVLCILLALAHLIPTEALQGRGHSCPLRVRVWGSRLVVDVSVILPEIEYLKSQTWRVLPKSFNDSVIHSATSFAHFLFLLSTEFFLCNCKCLLCFQRHSLFSLENKAKPWDTKDLEWIPVHCVCSACLFPASTGATRNFIGENEPPLFPCSFHGLPSPSSIHRAEHKIWTRSILASLCLATVIHWKCVCASSWAQCRLAPRTLCQAFGEGSWCHWTETPGVSEPRSTSSPQQGRTRPAAAGEDANRAES